MKDKGASLVRDSFYRLPHNLRRRVYMCLKPNEYQIRKACLFGSTNWDDIRPQLEYSCLFIHVPKTAGMAISKALFHGRSGGHRTLRDYSFLFSSTQFNKLHKFAFVREPLSRFISAYRFLMAGGVGAQDIAFRDEVIKNFPSINEFVIDWLTPSNLRKHIHFVPQIDFLEIKPGQIAVDFVGRFENLVSDFETTAQQLGKKCPLPRENTTKSDFTQRDYLDQLSYMAIARINQLYSDDYRILDYERPI